MTWIEVMNLVEASLAQRDERQGIRKGDLDKLQRVHNAMEQKVH